METNSVPDVLTRRKREMARKAIPKPKRNEHIGAKLRRLVEAKRGGRSLSDIAREADMTPGQLNKLFNGEKVDPKVSTLYRVLGTIDSTLCDLEQA